MLSGRMLVSTTGCGLSGWALSTTQTELPRPASTIRTFTDASRSLASSGGFPSSVAPAPSHTARNVG